MRYFSQSLIISAAAFLLGGLSAQALTATQIVEKEVQVSLPSGETDISYQDASLVIPGEVIRYRLDYTNDKTEAASDLVLTMPVPEVVTFIEGSANGPANTITYSIDGGETFSERGELTISDENGSRSATADDVTHIRWFVAGPVAVGESGTLSFKGVLK